LSYVMRVLRSVKNISIWNIVNYMHNLSVENKT
jgi:hypothetical protein